MFEDRRDAGQRLGRALASYKDEDVLVLAIPRGGVEVGYEVARQLDSEFSILVCRKLPFPYNPEAGFGAIAEDGSAFIFEDAERWLSKDLIEKIMIEQKKEIERRKSVLRDGEPLPRIKDRTVILVDDGIAMGSTMRAAIRLCRKSGAKKIIVAAPVSSREVEEEIGKIVEEIVVLEKPPYFRAVAEAYRNWYDVPDEEVVKIMDRWRSHKTKET